MQSRDSQPLKDQPPHIRAQLERLSPEKQPLARSIIAALENPAMQNPRHTINTILNQPQHLPFRNDQDIQTLAVDLLLFCQRQTQLWLTTSKLTLSFKINPEEFHVIQPDGALNILDSNHYLNVTKKNFHPACGLYTEEEITFSDEKEPYFDWWFQFHCQHIIKFHDGRIGAIYIAPYNQCFRFFEYKKDKLTPVNKQIWYLRSQRSWDYYVYQADHYEAVNCLVLGVGELYQKKVGATILFLDFDNNKIALNLTLEGYTFIEHHKLLNVKSAKCFEFIVSTYNFFSIYEIDLLAQTCILLKKTEIPTWSRIIGMSHDGKIIAGEWGAFPYISFKETRYEDLHPHQSPTIAKLVEAAEPMHIGSHWLFGDSYQCRPCQGHSSAKDESPQLFHLDTLTRHSLTQFPICSKYIAMPLQNAFYVIVPDSVSYCAVTESMHQPVIPSRVETIVTMLADILPYKMSLDVIRIINQYYQNFSFSMTVTPATLDYAPPRMFPRATQLQLNQLMHQFQQNKKRRPEYQIEEKRWPQCVALIKDFTDELNNLTCDQLTVKNVQQISHNFLEKSREKLLQPDAHILEEFMKPAIQDLEKNPWPVLNIRNAFRFFHLKVDLARPPVTFHYINSKPSSSLILKKINADKNVTKLNAMKVR